MCYCLTNDLGVNVKKQGGSNGGDKKQNILQMLGLAKKDVTAAPATKPPSKTKKPRTPPVAFDEASLNSRYFNFQGICADIAAFPQCREALLDGVIASEALFGRYIGNLNNLKTLIAMRPNQTATFVDMIMTKPLCQKEFMHHIRVLHALTEELKDYRAQLLTYAFEHKEIYSELLLGYFCLESLVNHFPDYIPQIFDLLLNDARLFDKCMDANIKNFCDMCKKDPNYTDRFIEHIFTSETIYWEVIQVGGLDYFLEEFPQYQDRMMNFILSSDLRFGRAFSMFEKIHEFGQKYPQYTERMYAKAMSMESYVREDIDSADEITDVYQFNPEIAQKIRAMMLADDQWILSSMILTDELEKAYKSELLRPIAEAYTALLYQNPDKFTFHIHNEEGLNRMLGILPKDQEPNLRHYYQAYVLNASEMEEHKPDSPPKIQGFK